MFLIAKARGDRVVPLPKKVRDDVQIQIQQVKGTSINS